MNGIGKLASLIHSVSFISGYISVVACGIMVLLCLSEIFTRTFFNTSLLITTELLGWLLVCLVFMGLSWTLSVQGHIQINLVVERLPQKIQQWLMICITIVSIGSLVLFCIWAWNGLTDYYSEGVIGFTFPLWWAWTPMFVGAVAFILQFLGTLLDSIASLGKSGTAAQ